MLSSVHHRRAIVIDSDFLHSVTTWPKYLPSYNLLGSSWFGQFIINTALENSTIAARLYALYSVWGLSALTKLM